MIAEYFDRLFRAVPAPYLLLSSAGDVIAANPAARQLLGVSAPPFSLASLSADPERVRAFLANASATAAPVPGALVLQTAEGEVRVRCHGSRIAAPDDDRAGILLQLDRESSAGGRFLELNREIESLNREMHARLAAERLLRDAQSRSAFLAEASRILGSSIELEQTLSNVARLAVPLFADWCAVDMLMPDGELRRVAVEHPDAAKVELAHQLRQRFPEDRSSPHGVWEVLRTGRTKWLAQIPESVLEAAATSAEHLEMIRALQLRSAVIAPLLTRERVLGAITFVFAESGRLYAEEDVGFAEDLARRAATAIDNARLLRASEEAHEQLAWQHQELERQNGELQDLADELEAQAMELEHQLELGQQLNVALEEARTDAEHTEQYVRSILEGISDPLVVHDSDWCFRYLNAAAYRVFEAVGHGDLVGRRVWDEYPQLRGTRIERELQRAMRDRVPVTFEDYDVDTGSWSEMRCYPLADGGVATVWKDVSERKRLERDTQFLAEASRVLASSLEFEATLRTVAALVVPELADWCAIDLLGEDNLIERVITMHSDPERRAWAEQVHASVAAGIADETGIGRVIRTGTPQLLSELNDELIERAAPTPLHRDVWSKLGMRSAMCVPLRAGERVLGAITFIYSGTGSHYDERDLQLALELGQRAGIAVENARLYRQAQSANRAKSDFLAVMSHELRTPLNAIMGYADLLHGEITGPINEQQKTQLARLTSAARQLLQLIDQILSLSRIEAGKEQVHLSDGDAVEVIREAVEMMEPAASKRGLSLRLDLPARLPLRTDFARMRQILLNLLSNAVKFTDEGSVALKAFAENRHVTVTVEDTGVGIAADALPRIFEPFVQVDSSATRRYGGTGLGLAVSRDLARLLGGSLTAESQPGHGSRFTLHLPLG